MISSPSTDEGKGTKSKLSFELWPKQALALESDANEVLYGGAAGGGKSHLARIAAILWAMAIPGIQIYLFRRRYDEAIKNHMEGPTGFRALLQPLIEQKLIQIVEVEIRFWNGSKVFICHCQHEKDRWNYQGAEMHVLIIEEATQFTELIIRFLRSRVRIPESLPIPPRWKGKFPRILMTSNPGNVGHHYLKGGFIDPQPAYVVWKAPKNDGGFKRQFIPARLKDNPSINPTEYAERLEGLGSPQLVRAMLDGDWDVVVGSFYPELERFKHGIQPFTIPAHWARFRSFDWGSYHPFSVGWWAVADGEPIRQSENQEIIIPRGSLIRYREWYGWQEGRPNVGLKMRNEELARGIVERTGKDEKILYTVTDSLPFVEEGGPSIAEVFRKNGVILRRGDTSRVAGWQQVRSRLKGNEGRPLLYVFETCLHFFRTMSALQHGDTDPEDIADGLEDHLPDEVRLACMSRAMTKKEVKPEDMRGIQNASFDEVIKANERRYESRY